MRPYDDPESFKFFAFGDPQPYSLREVGFFSKAIVEEAKNYDGVSFGISLGDIAGERLDLYRPYLEAMRGMGIPWYNVLGNHDRNYDATEDRLSNETFEATFGPTTHAFRFGNAHFILLDDILMSNPPRSSLTWEDSARTSLRSSKITLSWSIKASSSCSTRRMAREKSGKPARDLRQGRKPTSSRLVLRRRAYVGWRCHGERRGYFRNIGVFQELSKSGLR